ncbi:hypothetical protein QYE76_041604 [Lolium multiflorum]|uniref:Transposase-associated domain-containing protein n=1 Tax=Lolium multiflorum TaxID=4521 RepID=A0AAD8TFQ8_LOLMU|nr:hypothetical protein QYE76_041604 [Lolium multiflorum]
MGRNSPVTRDVPARNRSLRSSPATMEVLGRSAPSRDGARRRSGAAAGLPGWGLLVSGRMSTGEEMNRQWVYIDRRFDEFTSGLSNFMAVAEANKHGGFMYCPCVDCKNIVNYAHSSTIHDRLVRNGFMPSYYCWTKHGERGVMMEKNEEHEEDDDSYPMFSEYGDTAEGNEDNEAEDQETPDEPADDDLGRAIADVRRECETEKKRNPSKEIFSELDETFAQGPIFARSFQTEDLTKWGHEAARGWGAPAPAAPTCPRAPRVAPTFRLLKASVAKPPHREPRYGKPYETPPPRIPSRDSGDRLRTRRRGDSSPEDSSSP